MGHIINIPQIFRCHVIAIQLIPSDQLILVYLKPHRVLENYVILLVHTTFSRNFGRIKKVSDHLISEKIFILAVLYPADYFLVSVSRELGYIPKSTICKF